VDVSPDGQLLAIGVHAGHLFVVEVATGATVMKLEGHGGVPNGVRKVRFSPSGAQLASVSDDRTARVWSLADRTCTMVHEDPADVNAVDWVDEDHLVIGTDRMVRLLTTSGEELKAKSASGTAETRVSRERERIYVGSAGKIRVYSLTLAEKRKEHLSQKSLSRLRVHGDTLLATSWEGEDAGLMVWNLATGESHRPEAHRRKTFALDRHPTSGSVGVGGSPGVVERFTPAGALIPREGSFHTKEIEGIRCGPDLLTAGSDNQVIRWSATGDALGAYASPKGRLCSAVSDATRVYVTGTHFTAAFDRATGEPAWISPEPASRSEHLSLAADDRSLVVAGHRCLFWVDRTTGERLHTTDDIIGNWWIHWWADLPGGRLALAGYSDEAVQVFDTATREHVATWALPKSKGGTVCGIASAGDRVLISRRDKTLVVLDGRDGKVVTTATLGGSRYPIAATSDGRWLFGSSGRTVEVYDTERFQQVGAIEAPAKVSALAVDGERLLIGCSTGELATAPIP